MAQDHVGVNFAIRSDGRPTGHEDVLHQSASGADLNFTFDDAEWPDVR
jgi:hypothetical protein